MYRDQLLSRNTLETKTFFINLLKKCKVKETLRVYTECGNFFQPIVYYVKE